MEPEIRARLDQHIISAYALRYRTISGGLYEVMPHWIRGLSGLQVPIFNIFMPRTDNGLTDDALADTAAYYSSHNVFYAIELIHDKFPEGPEYLNKRNYQSLPPQPAMYFAEMPADIELNPQVTVRLVSTIPTLAAFCATLHAVFDYSTQDILTLYPPTHIKDNRIVHYLAFLDERPVAAASMVLAEGVASIWNVCTVDTYRQQGVATALLYQMLIDAHQPLALVYSTAQAYGLFSKMGFEIYTQRQWFLPPGIVYEE